MPPAYQITQSKDTVVIIFALQSINYIDPPTHITSNCGGVTMNLIPMTQPWTHPGILNNMLCLVLSQSSFGSHPMHHDILTRVHCQRPLRRITACPPSLLTAKQVTCPARVGSQKSRLQSSALQQATPLVEAPPASFDFRSASATESGASNRASLTGTVTSPDNLIEFASLFAEQLIAREFPELLDLAQQGLLQAHAPRAKLCKCTLSLR